MLLDMSSEAILTTVYFHSAAVDVVESTWQAGNGPVWQWLGLYRCWRGSIRPRPRVLRGREEIPLKMKSPASTQVHPDKWEKEQASLLEYSHGTNRREFLVTGTVELQSGLVGVGRSCAVVKLAILAVWMWPDGRSLGEQIATFARAHGAHDSVLGVLVRTVAVLTGREGAC